MLALYIDSSTFLSHSEEQTDPAAPVGGLPPLEAAGTVLLHHSWTSPALASQMEGDLLNPAVTAEKGLKKWLFP